MARLPRAAVLLGICALVAEANAQAGIRDDPYAYDLRVAAFPAAFQGGFSQSSFASAARAEVDVSRRFTLGVVAHLPWLPLAGETDSRGFDLRAGVSWNVSDGIAVERLGGTVYPEDTPSVAERGGVEFEMPVHQKLGGPRMALPDVDRDAHASLRNVHSIRLGYERLRAVGRTGPNPGPDGDRYVVNTLHGLYAGYSWGSHWNLSPATVGKREVGWRRFIVDVLATIEPLASSRPIESTSAPGGSMDEPAFIRIGARLGMEGSIGALLRDAPGVGFGYSVELGLLPGPGAVEGYLFVAFGVELDFMLHPRAR